MTETLQNALNEQITAELWSANLYLSMSCLLYTSDAADD